MESSDYESFISGIQFVMAEGRDILKVELSPAGPPAPKTIRVLLDLDYFLNKPEAVALDNALTWVGNAHDQIEFTFEACMQDAARKLLQPVKK